MGEFTSRYRAITDSPIRRDWYAVIASQVKYPNTLNSSIHCLRCHNSRRDPNRDIKSPANWGILFNSGSDGVVDFSDYISGPFYVEIGHFKSRKNTLQLRSRNRDTIRCHSLGCSTTKPYLSIYTGD